MSTSVAYTDANGLSFVVDPAMYQQMLENTQSLHQPAPRLTPPMQHAAAPTTLNRHQLQGQRALTKRMKLMNNNNSKTVSVDRKPWSISDLGHVSPSVPTTHHHVLGKGVASKASDKPLVLSVLNNGELPGHVLYPRDASEGFEYRFGEHRGLSVRVPRVPTPAPLTSTSIPAATSNHDGGVLPAAYTPSAIPPKEGSVSDLSQQVVALNTVIQQLDPGGGGGYYPDPSTSDRVRPLAANSLHRKQGAPAKYDGHVINGMQISLPAFRSSAHPSQIIETLSTCSNSELQLAEIIQAVVSSTSTSTQPSLHSSVVTSAKSHPHNIVTMPAKVPVLSHASGQTYPLPTFYPPASSSGRPATLYSASSILSTLVENPPPHASK